MSDIQAKLRFDITQFQDALNQVRGDIKGLKATARASGKGLSNDLFGGLKGGITAMLPAMGFAAIATGFKSATSSMDDLVDTALRLNESTEMIQRVEHASKLLASVDANGLVTSFLRLEKALGDLDNEEATKALADLGITAEKLAAAPLDEKILMMSEAFQKARASGTGYNDILDLLGKSAGDLIPMFMQTRETITGMFDDAHIIPDEEVQRLAEVNDQLDGYINNLKAWFVEVVGLGVKAIDSVTLSNADREARAKAKADKSAAAKAKPGPRAETAAEKAAAIAARREAEKLAKLEEAQTERIADKYIANARIKADLAMEEMTAVEKIAKLQEDMAASKLLEDSARAQRDIELQLDAQHEQLELEKKLRDARKEAADKERQITAEKKKQAAAVAGARNDVMMDIEVLRLRARGQDKKADKLETEKRIDKEAAQIVKDTGASEEQALKLAKERVELETKLDDRRNGRPGHIRGVKNKRYIGSGIDEFNQNQSKSETDPEGAATPGYKRGGLVPEFNDPLSGRGPRKGRMMGRPDEGGLSTRAARNAGEQDSREKQDTSTKDLLSQIAGILTTGLLG